MGLSIGGFSIGGGLTGDIFGEVGNFIGDITGSNAAAAAARQGTTQAMQAEREMFDESMAFQREMWDWQTQQAQQWTEAGLLAMGQYQDVMNQGFTFSPETDPVYQQRLEDQSRAIGTSGAGMGMQLSGRTLGALREMTAAELGSSYGRQFGEYQANLSNLGNMINIGRGSAMNLSNVGQGFTAGMTGAMQNLGQSQAQGYMNLGQIGAQAATAPFQNLMSLGTTAGSLMMGFGSMGGTSPAGTPSGGAYINPGF